MSDWYRFRTPFPDDEEQEFEAVAWQEGESYPFAFFADSHEALEIVQTLVRAYPAGEKKIILATKFAALVFWLEEDSIGKIVRNAKVPHPDTVVEV